VKLEQNNKPRLIMFADVSGSSSLYKKLGNAEAKRCIDRTLKAMLQQLQQYKGHLVKTIGDEVMAYFDSPSMGVKCAQSIQQYSNERKDLLGVRIGMDYGETLLEKGDVFGQTVNDAAYVSHVARSQEIVITHSLFEALSPKQKTECHQFDRIKLKGSKNKQLIYRLSWEVQTNKTHHATIVMSVDDISQQLQGDTLQLSMGNQQFILSPEQTPFVIGRDPKLASLHITSAQASREHCHIDFRRGKFVFVDNSTNGTYVSAQGEREIYLRREELPLSKRGFISVGQPKAQNTSDLISYSL